MLKDIMIYKKWIDDNAINSLLEAEKDKCQKSIDDIRFWLAHINIVDQIFKAHLSAQKHDYTSTVTHDLPSIQDLIESIHETDQWFIDYAETLDGNNPNKPIDFIFTDGSPGTLTPTEMLTHLLTHGLYHLSVLDQKIGEHGYGLKGVLLTTHKKSLSK